MAKIGSLGKDIIFETSDKRILSPTGFRKKVSARWQKHELINATPRQQFIGRDLDQVTFTLMLDARHGVRPRKTMANIESAIRNGTPKKLVLGKKAVGTGKYIITEVSESWDIILNKGEILKAKVDITLEQYN